MSVSVQDYLDRHKLSIRIEEAVNAAVRAQSEDPVAFIVSCRMLRCFCCDVKLETDAFGSCMVDESAEILGSSTLGSPTGGHWIAATSLGPLVQLQLPEFLPCDRRTI